MGHDLIIYNRAGEKKFNLFSRGSVCTVTKASQKQSLLADDTVSLSLTTAQPLDITIGDYITLFGRRYTVNQLPQPTKQGERVFSYEITLEGLQYALIDILYSLPADAYGDTYYADLQGHLDVLAWNVKRIHPGWTIQLDPEAYDAEHYENITASGKNALAMLQELCSLFSVEFEIKATPGGATIYIAKKAGTIHPFTLQYGRGRGLYQISRNNVNNAGITNRLYVYGASDNLPKDYGHTKLCLAESTRLTSYLEDADSIEAYGIKENAKTYSDIKPERQGVITALGDSRIKFVDASGDANDPTNLPMFDLNEKDAEGNTKYLIEGASAKIKFNTGNLAGYEFDLHKYDHATKTFTINRFTDESGLVIPNDDQDAFSFAVGDKYIITDIQLPDAYVKRAEAKLKAAALADFAGMTQPQVSYKLQLAEDFFTRLWGDATVEVLHPGDYLHIIDEQIGVDKEVRITNITRDLLRPHSYEITLSDTVTKPSAVRVLNDLSDIKEAISYNTGFTDPAKARRRWMASQEVLNMVFDPEGDYYSEKIKPLSIETQMLSVGAKSAQFTLNNVTIQPNYNGDPNVIAFSAGLLVHYGLDPDTPRTWSMGQLVTGGLSTATPYYIYAKCPTNNSAGTFILSTTQIKCESQPGWYYFLVGILNSADADLSHGGRAARLISLTYGASTINGRFIRCGRIESSGGGATYFDLDSGVICGQLKFVSGDGTVKDVKAVDTKNAEIEEYINTTLQPQLAEQQTQIDGKITCYYTTYSPTLDWPEEEYDQHVGDQWYNTSNKKLYRLIKSAWVQSLLGGWTVPLPPAMATNPVQSEINHATYYWGELQNADAIAAEEAAARAQDTADGKRTVYVADPVSPYFIGDLWLRDIDAEGRAAGGLWRCVNDCPTTGDFDPNDWVEATYYDATQTVIDGGIVTAGTVQLANSQTASICAGITGGRGKTYKETASTPASQKVRIWAGATEGTRRTAPFRVLENGKVYASNAEIKGVVKSTAGEIGGWKLHDGRLTSADKDSEGKTITPAVELNAAAGQIKAADSVVMDADGFNLMRDGYSMVKVANISVGEYSDNLLRKSLDYTASPQYFRQETAKIYIATPQTSYSVNPYKEHQISLGVFDNGSQIYVGSLSVNFYIPGHTNSAASVYLAVSNGLRVRLLRNGDVIKTWEGAAGFAGAKNGTYKTLTINPDYTHFVGKGEEGTYTLVIDSPGTWTWQADASGEILSFSITTFMRYKFLRSNYQRTLMGYDGLTSAWNNGYMFMNGSAFVVKFSNYALKIDTSGIKKSSDGGTTWSNL